MIRMVALICGCLLAAILAASPAAAYLDMKAPSDYYTTHDHFPAATSTVGGGGGAAMFDQCQTFHGTFDYLRGFELMSGNWIDSIIIECGKAQELQGELRLGKPYTSSMQWGGQTGALGGDLCESNEGVGGLRLQRSPNNFLGYVALLCRPLNNLGGLRLSDRAYGRISDKSPPAQDVTCPAGMIAVGISGGSGVYIDRLGLVCLPPPTVAHETILAGMEDNTNRAYSDYTHFTVPVNGAAQCQNSCLLQSNKCRAWAYVREGGLKGPDAICYLKNSVPAAFHDDCCISGVTNANPNPVTERRDCFMPPCAPVSRTIEEHAVREKMTYKPGPIIGEPGGIAGLAPPIEGTYDSDFGVLMLTKTDGTYSFKDGRVTLSKIYGDFVDGTWSQSESGQQCSDGSYRGTFHFSFTQDGFTGSYGYCDGPTNAGPWNGKRR